MRKWGAFESASTAAPHLLRLWKPVYLVATLTKGSYFPKMNSTKIVFLAEGS